MLYSRVYVSQKDSHSKHEGVRNMKTVIFILALFIVNMMISTYAFNDEKTNATNPDVFSANANSYEL